MTLRAATVAVALLALAALYPSTVSGQSDAVRAQVDELGTELVEAQRTHIRRVLWWGGANLLLGAGLVAAGRDGHRERHGFGIQTAAWGTINIGIALWATRAGFDLSSGPTETLAAEDGWAHILLVNLGLNAGYIAVGTALNLASRHGLRSGDAVRGHANAVIVQGLGLMVLDGLAWASSRGRLERLRELAFEGWTIAASPLDPGAIEIGLRIPLGG